MSSIVVGRCTPYGHRVSLHCIALELELGGRRGRERIRSFSSVGHHHFEFSLSAGY